MHCDLIYDPHESVMSIKYSNLPAGTSIFVQTPDLPTFVYYIYPRLTSPIILVSGDGVGCAPRLAWKHPLQHYPLNLPVSWRSFLNDPYRIAHWFIEDLDVAWESVHHKTTMIPLGINFHDAYLDYKLWGKDKWNNRPVMQEKALHKIRDRAVSLEKRRLSVYADFHHTNRSQFLKTHGVVEEDRADIYQKLKENRCVYFSPARVSREETWKRYAEYSFVISPHGNYLDCYRTWEILALGSIPVVKTSSLDPLYDHLPVIIVGEWNQITYANIKIWREMVLKNMADGKYKMDMLTNDYWKNEISYRQREARIKFQRKKERCTDIKWN